MPTEAAASNPSTDSKPPAYCCYGCRVLGENRPPRTDDPSSEPQAAASWFRIGVGVALASQAMLLGFAVNLSPPEGAIRGALHAALAASALIVLMVLGWPLLKASWECVGRRRITVELLFLVGIVGAFGASLFSSFTGIGAVYYEVVAVLLVVYTVGKTLTARARERAWAETARLRDTFNCCQRVRADGTLESIPVTQIQPGDQVRVLPNEPVPVDGRVLFGQSFVRETPLTGEPHPVVRRAGDSVWAGSWTEDGELLLEATASGRTRRLDELLHWVEHARSDGGEAREAASPAWIDRLTTWFLPIIIAVAVATFAAWTWHGQWAPGLFNALAVLLVACPCALGLAAPLAWWHALATLAARGVMCRSPDVLERLAEIRHVVFDKTGTLSEERQSLIDFAAVGGPTERQHLLELLGAIQGQSAHPIARAFAQDRTVNTPRLQVRAVKSIPACGLEAWIEREGQELRVQTGTRDWVLAGAKETAAVETALLAEVRARSLDQRIYVAVEGHLVGLGVVRERLRDSAREAWTQLGQLGCEVTILTGDHTERAAQLLAPTVPNDAVRSTAPTVEGSLTPTAKAERIQALEASGSRVAFVGDGINDAPALRAARVGIALNSGAALATASADVVLCGGDLREVPRTLALARRVRGRVRSNLLFALAYNLLGIVLAATGRIGPISAALLMVGSSTIVSWRALRSSPDPCEVLPDGTETPATWWPWLTAFSLILQLPLIGWLGQLRPAPLAVVTLIGLGLATISLHFGQRLATSSAGWLRPVATMTLAMLGPGNLGMLLGWWIEAGFDPVMRDGVCLCCQSHHYFALTGKIPWMYLGMLLGGLPPMWASLLRLPGRLGPWFLAALATVGMVLGMATGADAVLSWLGPRHPHQFLGALSGMSVGMLLGMFFACAAGEALAAALSRRPRR